MKKHILTMSLLATSMVALAMPAFAQVVPTADEPITYATILAPLQDVIIFVVSAAVLFVLWRIAKSLGININKQTQDLIDNALRRSLEYGASQVLDKLDDKDDEIKFNNAMLDMAAGYFLQYWPSTAKNLGATVENVKEMLKARLPEFYADMLATPDAVITPDSIPAIAAKRAK